MSTASKLVSGAILLVLSGLLIYLALGPPPNSEHPPDRENLVARVSGQPITRSQLDRALAEQLWLAGKSATQLTTAELQLARQAALAELIDHELLRLQVKTSTPEITVSPAEIDARLQRFTTRFESKSALEAAMKSQGIATEPDLRARLAAHIRQLKFIERSIQPAIAVAEDEARQWFQENQATISQPERIQVRHVFLPTLDHPPAAAQQRLATALAALLARQTDFPTLAREISEDPASKDHGGTLGWMTRDRLPSDFAAPAFSMELHQPALIQTKLGWHLVEITDHKPATPRTFEQAKPEILAALQALKRRQATTDFRHTLRTAPDVKIEIF